MYFICSDNIVNYEDVNICELNFSFLTSDPILVIFNHTYRSSVVDVMPFPDTDEGIGEGFFDNRFYDKKGLS